MTNLIRLLVLTTLTSWSLLGQEKDLQNINTDSADIVFIGTVQKIETKQLKGRKYQVTLNVDSIISYKPKEFRKSPFHRPTPFHSKNSKATIFTKTTDIGCDRIDCDPCGYDFETNKKYVIFIDQYAHDLNIVTGCSKTEKLK